MKKASLKVLDLIEKKRDPFNRIDHDQKIGKNQSKKGLNSFRNSLPPC